MSASQGTRNNSDCAPETVWASEIYALDKGAPLQDCTFSLIDLLKKRGGEIPPEEGLIILRGFARLVDRHVKEFRSVPHMSLARALVSFPSFSHPAPILAENVSQWPPHRLAISLQGGGEESLSSDKVTLLDSTPSVSDEEVHFDFLKFVYQFFAGTNKRPNVFVPLANLPQSANDVIKSFWEKKEFERRESLIDALCLELGAPQTISAKPSFRDSLGLEFVQLPGSDVHFGTTPVRLKDYHSFHEDAGYVIPLNQTFSLGSIGWQQAGHDWRDPGFAQGMDHPVVGVALMDAHAYCKWMTKQEQGNIPSGWVYRLPTDLEWSLAVGLPDQRQTPPKERMLQVNAQWYPWSSQAWPPPSDAGNYAGPEKAGHHWPSAKKETISSFSTDFLRTSPVGSFQSNALGIYDLGGNVWEWCEDEFYPDSKTTVLRGASWFDDEPERINAAYRYDIGGSMRSVNFGFRCVIAEKGNKIA